MTVEEISELETAVRKAKFALSQKASELHDLIEDRLPVDYKEIPELSNEVFQACKIWDELNQQLQSARR